MLRLQLKPEAEKDLEKIYQYTYFNWGIEQADIYQDDLFNGMKRLRNHSELGNKYPYSKIEYQKLHVNRHLIFYRIEKQTCIVVRILHDSMELKKHIK